MTPAANGATILIADDDPDLRDILRSVLEPAGFLVSEARDGDAALRMIRQSPPDLAILDFMMPGLNGPQVCEQIKQDTLLRHLPVIMLTGKSEVQDKVYGIHAGADDYVVKPFEPQELLARVYMVLRRTAIDLEANPLTKLPGNLSIQRELERRIASSGGLAVCYIDLDRFKAFNDHYGFERGDQVIKQTAEVLILAAQSQGSGHDFVGHIGGDDFLLMTTVERAEGVCRTIIERFDAMVPQLYDEADRTRGYLLHKDRKGQEVKVPLLSISIALVTNEWHPLTHPGQVAKIGAELKAYAKQFDRSIYVKERRQPSSG
ncbi:MAG: response regulator [Candidatus Omnitrophica bacterium]|nr:response regulator [Candidatus Omnitrophota bacterium]